MPENEFNPSAPTLRDPPGEPPRDRDRLPSSSLKHPLSAIVGDDQLPTMATHCDQADCGFSIYGTVLVRWDEDRDRRVLDVIDTLPRGVYDRLLVIQEHEASLALVWDGEPPEGYREGDSVDVPDGDIWNVYSSVAARSDLTDK